MAEMDFVFTRGVLEYRIHGEKRRKQLKPGEDLRWEHGSVTWRDESAGGGRRISVICETCENVELVSAFLEGDQSYPDDASVFCNGFQSWTTSREYRTDERIPDLLPLGRLFRLDKYGDYHFIDPFRKEVPLYSHSWTYLRQGGGVDFWGSLSESEGYTLFLHSPGPGRFRVVRDCQGVIRGHEYPLFDFFLFTGNEDAAFTSYFTLLGLPDRKKTLTGWTSWYNYYTDISESIILENLDAFSSAGIPADVFQIDDGYQTAVGDWLSLKDSFPRGMKFLADRITAAGYRPGIWLAPFVCSGRSVVRKQHPEWILNDFHGYQVHAGWNPGWDGSFYALDIYNEGFRNHLKRVFKTVVSEWGFRVLKLDFLYAAAIVPRLGKSRGEVMAEGVRFLSEIAGDAEILGCGVPLSSCMGEFSFCRIGSDVGPKWEDGLLKFLRYRERVSTVNSLTSTIGRRQLGGRAFLNDPDVFILREGVKMSRDQRETLFLLNVVFGDILFTSDLISDYDPETLELFRSIFPARERRVNRVAAEGDVWIIDFMVGPAEYRAYANLGKTRVTVTLPEGRWVRQYTPWTGGDTAVVDRCVLSPQAVRYFQRLTDGYPAVAGGTGHLFPAAFVESALLTGDSLSIVFSPDAPSRLRVHLFLPRAGRFRVNGRLREAGPDGVGGGIITCGKS